MDFLQSPTRPDLRLEATKAILQCVTNRAYAQELVHNGILKPLLKVVSAAADDNDNDNDNDNNGSSRDTEASENALQSLLYLTSATQELANAVVQELLDAKAVPRLVELVLSIPPTPHTPIMSATTTTTASATTTTSDKRRINWAMALLANLTRTEMGALELVGKTLPDEAVYDNNGQQDDDENETASSANNNVNVKPTLELLLDRFLNPNLVADTTTTQKASSDMYTARATEEPHQQWDNDDDNDNALYEHHDDDDPYQHFAAVLMNATQVPAGSKFVMRIPRPNKKKNNMAAVAAADAAVSETMVASTATPAAKGGDETKTTTTTATTTAAAAAAAPSAAQQPQQQQSQQQQPPPPPLSVLQRLLPQLQHSCNPIRRRGLSGLVRNVCLDGDATWWLVNVANIVTPILAPLVGPEHLDWDEKKGMDPDLWMAGPDTVREVDTATRRHCVEAVLLLCTGGGRGVRRSLRQARADVILTRCDMVETSETVSERIAECLQALRRDGVGNGGNGTAAAEGAEEGADNDDEDDSSADGSGEYGGTGSGNNIKGLLEAEPAARVTIGGGREDDDVDYDTVD